MFMHNEVIGLTDRNFREQNDMSRISYIDGFENTLEMFC